jgi:hypothetical protein
MLFAARYLLLLPFVVASLFMLSLFDHKPLSAAVNTPDDSVYRWVPYYKFVQSYDSSIIECIFGECRILPMNGNPSYAYPFEWQPYHSPLCLGTLDSLNHVSRTTYFSCNPGDTILYYKLLRIQLGNNGIRSYCGISDTVFFITKVIDSASGNIVAIGDTCGIYPTDSLVHVPNNLLFPTNWHGILLSIIAPDSVSSSQKLSLSIESVFHGDTGNEAICRVDFPNPVPLSDQTLASMEMKEHLIDSIVSLGKRKPITTGLQATSSVRFEISPLPIKYGGVTHFTITSREREQCMLVITNSIGRTILRLQLDFTVTQTHRVQIATDDMTPGIYYVSMTNSSNKLLGARRFTVLK